MAPAPAGLPGLHPAAPRGLTLPARRWPTSRWRRHRPAPSGAHSVWASVRTCRAGHRTAAARRWPRPRRPPCAISRWSSASRVLLVGYSRGAKVLPFILTRLPPDLQRSVSLVALVGPSHLAGFEFHFSDLLTGWESGGRPTVGDSPAPGLPAALRLGERRNRFRLPRSAPRARSAGRAAGGHHFGRSWADWRSRSW